MSARARSSTRRPAAAPTASTSSTASSRCFRPAFPTTSVPCGRANSGNARFARTVIFSRHRLTYQEALVRLHRPATDDLDRFLQKAWTYASALRKRRFASGALDLDFPELRVLLDRQGRPDRIEKESSDESHQLIEEFMLLANEAVARHLN
ncbi:MAG: RNB domain-containing ribonuclease, partial [Verrucomicrobia bacterium]|nr:RNB domain-containing ribonuclease [Verrucomicrobiota bacterium]